jgi:arylsulfatase A-like enzyme
VHEGGSDDDVIDAAIEFVRAYGSQRWFLYLHLMDLHEYTYDEDSARFGSTYSDVYDNAILHTNFVLDRLIAHLTDTGQLDRTLVVIGSDHGEAFGERGVEGHARNVYRESTEIPWILAFPFRLDPGIEIDTRTSNVDVWPTVLDLLGLPPLPAADGRSRVPEILAAARGDTAAASADTDGSTYAHLDQRWGTRGAKPTPTLSVVEGPFRLVRTFEPGDKVRDELFDVRDDPSEERDRLAEHPDVAARLRERADAYLANEPAPWARETTTLEIDEIQLDQLRALGYAIP